jgi:DNA-binding MarR family transcriptional regulator
MSVRSDAPDLSARQMALLLSVYMEPGPHTVRALAQALKISKPAVSRALDRLGELGYIRRQRDDFDRRNVLVQRTGTGAGFLAAYAKMIQAAEAHVATLPETMGALDDSALAVPAAENEAGWSETVAADVAA